MPREIRIYWLDDGEDTGWRLLMTGSDTYSAHLGPADVLPEDAPLHGVLRAAAEATEPAALTPLQQEIAGRLAQGEARKVIAETLPCSLSAVDQVARRVQGAGRPGRPRKAVS